MKSPLIFSGILLSLCGYSFGADSFGADSFGANSNSVQLKELANLVEVSGYLQAAKAVGLKDNGDLHIYCDNTIPLEHFQWLKKIADASQESKKHLKDLCTTIGSVDLASLLVSARFLEISPEIQIIMLETLRESVSEKSFAKLGLKPNGDLDLSRCKIIPPDHFEWLEKIRAASRESEEELKKICNSINPFTLASLLQPARLLMTDQSTETTMTQALTNWLCQNPSNASSMDQQLNSNPIGKVAVIKEIIQKGFPPASINIESPIKYISMSPNGKWIITINRDSTHADLFRTRPNLSYLDHLPFFGWKPEKIFFSENGETVTIVTKHVIVAFRTGDLTSAVIARGNGATTTREVPQIFTFKNQDNIIHDAVPSNDYERVTILYEDKKAETLLGKNCEPLQTSLPAGSDGNFNLFAYHPGYSNNSVVATTEFKRPDTTQVWNHFTGETLYSVRTTEEEPIVAISFKRLFAAAVLALREEKKVTFWSHEDPSSPYKTHKSEEPIKAMSISKPHNCFYSDSDPRVQVCLSPDGDFIAAGRTNADNTATVEFSSNDKALTIRSIVAALEMIDPNQ